jgi:nucleoid-associated protein YgaU
MLEVPVRQNVRSGSLTMTRRRQLAISGPVLACALLFGVTLSWSQSLDDIARRERARKERQPPRAKRVYTEEDLARPKILDAEDRARFKAARKSWGARASEQVAEVPQGGSPSTEISLGEIARRYRLLKQTQETLESNKARRLPLQPALASPVFSRPPAVPPPEPISDASKARAIGSRGAPKDSALRTAFRVRVQPGDSLWKLAKRYLARGTQWRQLAALNPEIANPDFIRVGNWIRLPLEPSSAGPANRFRVRKGDSMWKLARAELGRGEAWICIAEANSHLQNVNFIYPGQTLVIPATCSIAP